MLTLGPVVTSQLRPRWDVFSITILIIHLPPLIQNFPMSYTTCGVQLPSSGYLYRSTTLLSGTHNDTIIHTLTMSHDCNTILKLLYTRDQHFSSISASSYFMWTTFHQASDNPSLHHFWLFMHSSSSSFSVISDGSTCDTFLYQSLHFHFHTIIHGRHASICGPFNLFGSFST